MEEINTDWLINKIKHRIFEVIGGIIALIPLEVFLLFNIDEITKIMGVILYMVIAIVINAIYIHVIIDPINEYRKELYYKKDLKCFISKRIEKDKLGDKL
jgi:hypothetical protein